MSGGKSLTKCVIGYSRYPRKSEELARVDTIRKYDLTWEKPLVCPPQDLPAASPDDIINIVPYPLRRNLWASKPGFIFPDRDYAQNERESTTKGSRGQFWPKQPPQECDKHNRGRPCPKNLGINDTDIAQ
jgi:hypothetical protein